jgi:general secretion pathway protein B
MSYILDALRKSETERRQGRIPDLGQQVQLIHKPRKKSIPVLVWVAVGLVLNAAVLAWVLWPQGGHTPSPDKAVPSASIAVPAPTVEPAIVEAEPEASRQAAAPERVPSPPTSDTLQGAIEIPTPGANTDSSRNAVAETGDEDERERPTVIVPTPRTPSAINPGDADGATTRSAPHLVELPLSFQKKVPDLIFNSHIYASEPSARRVMINDNYLRPGESFSGITVERITEEGVELSMDGRRFRVGVVRNWVSPN